MRGLPELFGELPVSVLAEEIETPGEGQVRALITVAGNPILSTPNSDRLEGAVEGLDFMLSIDIYVNETTRHADVVLPAPEPLEKAHYDLAFYQLSTRNIANYSPAIFEREGPAEWEVFMRLAGVIAGQGPNADVALFDDMVIQTLIQREVGNDASPLAGRDPAELLEALEPRRGPERVLDFMLRSGPYGDGFGSDPEGLTLDLLEQNPHGIDLGPLQPRLPEVLRTASGKVELAPRADRRGPRPPARRHGPRAERRDGADRPPPAALEQLVDAQPPRAREGQGALHAPHPSRRRGAARARRRRVARGSARRRARSRRRSRPPRTSCRAWCRSRTAGATAPTGVRMGVASAHAGVNSNVLADESMVEPLSGNAVLNGIPVEVSALNGAGASSRRSCGR